MYGFHQLIIVFDITRKIWSLSIAYKLNLLFEVFWISNNILTFGMLYESSIFYLLIPTIAPDIKGISHIAHTTILNL